MKYFTKMNSGVLDSSAFGETRSNNILRVSREDKIGENMRRFIWIVLILALVVGVTGCSRTKRIANDVDWIVFDGQPSEDN